MKRVTRRELVILAVILTGFSIFAVPRILFHAKGGMKLDWAKKAGQVYYCPMHPTYTSDRPGDCPICNMKLVPKPDSGAEGGKKERKILYYRHPMGQPDTSPVPKKDAMGMDYIPVYEDESAGTPSQIPGHATIQIPLEKQQLIGVKLGTVKKQKFAPAIRTTGRVVYDPELFTAQQEFLSIIASLKKAEGGPYHEPLERTKSLVNSARTRLRLLGMSEKEIEELEQSKVQDRNLILPEGGGPARQLVPTDVPMSMRQDSVVSPFVWVYATVYEYELPLVRVGTPAKVRPPTFQDREFVGEVRALDPVLDSTTRSIRVRARIADPEGFLKPEMYVDVFLEPESTGEALLVPEEAVMQTGERAIVFVSRGDGYFEPREVKLGTKARNFYEVKTGLQAGEQIVVSGNFLIDSESRLQAALQGMTSGGGHQHGP